MNLVFSKLISTASKMQLCLLIRYYITINAKQITRYCTNVVTRETKFRNNFLWNVATTFTSIYPYNSHICSTYSLLHVTYHSMQFSKRIFSSSQLYDFFFFFKRNIRGFKINEFEVESLLMDIHIFIIQLIISIYRIICFFSSTISPRIFNFRYLPMKTFTNFPYI